MANDFILNIFLWNKIKKINYPYSDDVLYTYGTEADNTKDNYAAGRLLNRIDNSGTVSYTYGRLGEMTSQTKTVKRLTPNRDPETATLQYKSDYLGRMQQITYPDNEVLTYTYDAGGQIKKVTGVRFDFEFPYIKDIGYDEYSQRSFIEYGNGIKTEYAYDPNRRWLSSIKTTTATGTGYQNMTYSFDLVGNITNYTNNTDGIKTSQSYTYDSQYQLIGAEGLSQSGVYDGLPNYNVSSYSQKFTFDSIGNITNKQSTSRTDGANRNLNLNYKKEYKYYAGKAHQAESVGNFYYRYDLNGNMIEERAGGHAPEPTRKEPVLKILEEREDATIYGLNEGFAIEQNSVKPVDKSYNRKYKWDEENRLITTMDSNITVQYKYDADGERTIKYSSRGESIYFDSLWQMHTSQSLLLQSKHIYFGQSRVSTKLSIKGESSLGYEKINNYYYHPDHLGSSQLITDYRGWKYEHLEYTPYGELWVNRKAEKLNKTPFTFTGKEMDAETGLYYYGARYMNPQNSLWISADPALIDGSYFAGGIYNALNLAGYTYAFNNPVMYTDPDGRSAIEKNIYSNSLPRLQFLTCTSEQTREYERQSGLFNKNQKADTYISDALTNRFMVNFQANTVDEILGKASDVIRQVGQLLIPGYENIRSGLESLIVEGDIAKSAERFGLAVAELGTALMAGALLGKATSVGSSTVTSGVAGNAAGRGIKTAEDILRPGGKLLGEAGTSSKIRILQGSADDAAKLFDDLAAGGKPITGTSYPGRMVELPGGGVVKIRPSGTSGNFPTIDVDIPGIGIREIKFKP